jgi:hypothetical protein
VRDASYVVAALQAFLPLESSRKNRGKFGTWTTMALYASPSKKSISVFCDYLRHPNCLLRAITLVEVTPKQARRVLKALETNISVVQISMSGFDHPPVVSWMGRLLLHKTNFAGVAWDYCPLLHVSRFFLSGIGSQHEHIRSLTISSCSIGDESFGLILEELCRVHLPHLELLNLSDDCITPIGLQVLMDALPLAFSHLKRRDLHANQRMFADEQTTQRFVDRGLLSDDVAIDELDVDHDGSGPIIKSCEHEKSKLRVLDISPLHGRLPLRRIRDQFVESLPKMKRLQELICNSHRPEDSLTRFMATRDGKALLVDPEIMAALHQNTSLVKLSDRFDEPENPLLVPILGRSQMLLHADSLLAVPPPTAGARPQIHSRSNLWPVAFASMKLTVPNSIDPAHRDCPIFRNVGASAIFKILREHPVMLRFDDDDEEEEEEQTRTM